MQTLSALFTGQMARALCNTLLHSLWQGVLLAIVTGIIVLCTRSSRASTRYNSLVAALTVFTLGAVVTFICEWHNAATAAVSGNAAAYMPAVVFEQVQYGGAATDSLTVLLQQWINQHTGALVQIWLLLFTMKTIQLLAGLHGTWYMRRYKTAAVTGYWQQQLQQLSNRLQLRQKVQLLESQLAKVPMVIGHMKPVLLLPIGLLNNLPPDETTAILIHELAHIRRRDYLVNLLQSLVETVFFFNPAIWWIAALLRTERENCCDDIAVAHTGNKAKYIRALVSCQEYHTRGASAHYAMTLGKKGGALMQRVQRMIGSRNRSLNRWEKLLLSLCIVAVLVVAGIPAFEQRKQPSPAQYAGTAYSDTTRKKAEPPYEVYKPEEISSGTYLHNQQKWNGQLYHTYLVKEKDGVLYQIVFADDQMSSLYINGKAIPQNEWAAYRKKIEKLTAAPAPPAAPFAIVPDHPEAAETPEPAELQAPAAPTPAKTAKGATAPAAQSLPLPPPAPKTARAAQPVITTDVLMSPAASAPAIPAPPTPGGKVTSSGKTTMSTDVSGGNFVITRDDSGENVVSSGYVPRPDKPNAEQVIINELLKRKIITSTQNLRFTISTENGLKVNDVQQPDAVCKAILQQLGTGNDHFSMAYSKDTKD
ncbi:M56 family metallopeptidase [Deminuibacter soli]|uniref:Peptidase M56 domain-containing protein n=1 Tax=Deminuibacter soli TaxID=2291815 RepID=A0A3E1NJ95_9BACT|nr:M56 family metallopeptidase [Deminuibacter soli]RFM28007.1 hypothetical protein DXN05_10725 [Deminuibacter soli]